MTAPEVIETIIRTPSGGAMTDENKLDRDFVASNMHLGRAWAMNEWLKKPQNGIHDLWFQSYEPTYTPTLQSNGDCVVRFKCPPVINLPGRDGFEYVGTDDDLNNFASAGPGAMKSVYSQHRITNRRGLTKWDWSYNEGGYGEMVVQGNKLLQRIKVIAIFADPLELPTFRQDKDEYPISIELIPFMVQYLFQLQTKIIVERKADVIPNSQDINNQGQ